MLLMQISLSVAWVSLEGLRDVLALCGREDQREPRLLVLVYRHPASLPSGAPGVSGRKGPPSTRSSVFQLSSFFLSILGSPLLPSRPTHCLYLFSRPPPPFPNLLYTRSVARPNSPEAGSREGGGVTPWHGLTMGSPRRHCCIIFTYHKTWQRAHHSSALSIRWSSESQNLKRG